MLFRLLAFLVVAAAVACSASDPEPPAETSTVIASASPSGVVQTASTQSTATATPAPQPVEYGWHPRGTRSGVPVVDAVLDAFERRDGATVRAFLRPTQLPCMTHPTAMDTVRCPEGVPDGTLVSVIPYMTCEPNYFFADEPVDAYGPPTTYPILPLPYTGLLAVLRLDPSVSMNRYAILNSHNGLTFIDDKGITGVTLGSCNSSTDDLLTDLYAKGGASVILPLRPPKTASLPSYPRGTRTSIGIADEVIESVDGRDVNRFLGLFQFTDLPCTDDGYTQFDVIRCLDNSPQGTPTGAVALGACTGVFYGVNREKMDANLVISGSAAMGLGHNGPWTTAVYAVMRGDVLPYALPVPVETVIVIDDGRVFGVGAYGVTFFETSCRWTAEDVVRDMERRHGPLDYVLRPLK